MKDTQSEIKQNIQGTRTEGKESDSHRRFGPQGRNEHIRPEQNKETRIQKKKKMRRGLGTSGTTLSAPTSES